MLFPARIYRIGFFLAALVALAAPLPATVTGGAVVGESADPKGVFVKLTVPLANPLGPANSVGQDTFNSPNLYAFDEDQNITLKADLLTDVGQNPIPAGKVVASHYVFFDPGPGTEVFGVVDFDSRVLAIITGTGTLAASDFLANTGVNYLNPSARGLEPGDYVAISDTKQITFHTVASSPGDYVRVLTEFSPKARMLTSNRRNGIDALSTLLPRLFTNYASKQQGSDLPLLARRGGPSDIKRYREATTQRGGVVGQARAKNSSLEIDQPPRLRR